MNWKYLVSWIPGIPIAIVNGLFRTSLYMQFLTELHAHQLSAVSFIVLFGIYVWFVLKWLKLSSAQEAFRLGLTWLVLTVSFEFLFGHIVVGNPWREILQVFNVRKGDLFVVALLVTLIAPWLSAKLRGLI